MPLSGRLRRKATAARRRARHAAIPQWTRGRSDDAQPHGVEIFSEDFKLLRTLLILLFALFVLYVGKTIDRWAAATTINEHFEDLFFQAVQTSLLTKPLELRVSSAAVEGDPSTLGTVRIEPEAGAPPLMLVDVAAQALHALKARGLDADHTTLSLQLPDEAESLIVRIGVGPLHPALADRIRTLQRTPLKDIQGLEAGYALARESCPGTPIGASMRFSPDPTGKERWEGKGVALRAEVPQAEIGIFWMSSTERKYQTPKFKLLMFYAPDVYQLKRPLRCARAYAPALATWTAPAVPEIRVHPGELVEKKPVSLHERRSARDFTAAREEMEASNFKLLDMLQVSFDNLFLLFPVMLLVLSAISSSVLRRIALALPPGVAVGDVLLTQRGSRRALSLVDGALVRGIEKVVRFALLTLAIFCPFLVILTLPVVADAGLFYDKVSQPVTYLFHLATSSDAAFWLVPLAVSLLLAAHQWGLIMSPPSAPLIRSRPFRWMLILLLGLPSTLCGLLVGAVIVKAGVENVLEVSRRQDPGGLSAKLLGINLAILGLGLVLIALIAGFWWWVMRSQWLGTRRGHRTVIGCCVAGVLVLTWPVAELFKADASPGTFVVLSAVGFGWCLWMLSLLLKPR